jgi:hypothetical protein
MIPHTKYLSSRPCTFKGEDFLEFISKIYFKPSWPRCSIEHNHLQLHAGNIQLKVHYIWPGSLKTLIGPIGFWEDVVCIKSWRRRTDGRTNCDHKSSPIHRQKVILTSAIASVDSPIYVSDHDLNEVKGNFNTIWMQ